MGILFIVALILAWPTFGLSVVAYVALLMVRSYLRHTKKVDHMMRRADFRSLMEPLFQGRSEEFFLALDIPTRLGREFTQEEARECMRHVMYFLADNPNEAALFMRGLENRRAKSGDAGLDPISAALYERNRNLKDEIHLLVYRAIATIKAANPSLRCFDKVDDTEICLRIADVSTSPPAAGSPVIASQLGEDLLQARWISLLKRIGRDEATKLLSLTQALDAALIQRYESSWDWKLLSRNEMLPWSLELIERFEDRLDWEHLSGNEALPWSLELIERYKDRWDWERLSGNEALPWSIELIERFRDEFDYFYLWDWGRLSYNKALPWSPELIERFTREWWWSDLSANEALPWSLELIERYVDRWDWGLLSANEALPWSLELIERYDERLRYHLPEDRPWSLKTIELYKARWTWRLSKNKALPWSPELIERYEDRWAWQHLSRNRALPWSLELIERYEDRWHWRGDTIGISLSENEGLPWSLELIERYVDRWDWIGVGIGGRGLSGNEGLPWSLELIERYKDRWSWGHLSKNKALPWSPELIERYEDRWGWGVLAANEALPWSLELIERFENRWDWDSARKGLQRTKVLVLNSSAIDGLMTHFAYLEHETTGVGATRDMTSSEISVIEYAGGELFVVMHNGKRIVIALDFDLPAAIAGHAPDKPKIREFLPSRADQHISTHPIYECSNGDRDLILAACDEAVTRHLSSLSDKP